MRHLPVQRQQQQQQEPQTAGQKARAAAMDAQEKFKGMFQQAKQHKIHQTPAGPASNLGLKPSANMTRRHEDFLISISRSWRTGCTRKLGLHDHHFSTIDHLTLIVIKSPTRGIVIP
jgi:hypothetical protein